MRRTRSSHGGRDVPIICLNMKTRFIVINLTSLLVILLALISLVNCYIVLVILYKTVIVNIFDMVVLVSLHVESKAIVVTVQLFFNRIKFANKVERAKRYQGQLLYVFIYRSLS